MEHPIFGLLILCIFFGVPIYCMTSGSGWSLLQELYQARTLEGLISEGSYRLVHCKSRWLWLTLAVEIYPTGLWLRIGFPLNVFMRSVLLPWESLSVVPSRALIFRGTALRVEGWPYHIEILGRPGKAIRRKLETQANA